MGETARAFLPLQELAAGAAEIGIELSAMQLEQFEKYAVFLVETNARFNLTRITAPEDIVTNHYLDSLLCLSSVEFAQGSRVVDVGTGAGFPGIPLKIARPDLAVALVDSTYKKVGFLQQVVELLNLSGVEPVHARAEQLGADPVTRESYDICCCRALAGLKIAAELCLPLVKVGGRVIAQKSERVDKEVLDARQIVAQLGGRVEACLRERVPGTQIVRGMVILTKVKPTPRRYPRPYAQISRNK